MGRWHGRNLPKTRQYYDGHISAPTGAPDLSRTNGRRSTSMQLKIGFINSQRELAIDLDKNEVKQAELVEELQNFLTDGTATTTVVEDARGTKTVLLREQIAYIQVGAEKPRSVGFI
ncbi:DUF3107 domain-containing protein [Corynebacterium urealyticum]|nr:DUF3107 domain-containing protein [Corynebacterium urealyticum]